MRANRGVPVLAAILLATAAPVIASSVDDVGLTVGVHREFIRWDDTKRRIQIRAVSLVRTDGRSTAVILAVERKDGRRVVLSRCVVAAEGVTRSRVLLPASNWWLEMRESPAQEGAVTALPGQAQVFREVEITTSYGRSENSVLSAGDAERDPDHDAVPMGTVLLAVDDRGRLRGQSPDEARWWFPFFAEMADMEEDVYLSGVLAFADQFFMAVELSANFARERNRTRIRVPSSFVSKRARANESDEFAKVLTRFPELDSRNPFSGPIWPFSECDLDESGDS